MACFLFDLFSSVCSLTAIGRSCVPLEVLNSLFDFFHGFIWSLSHFVRFLFDLTEGLVSFESSGPHCPGYMDVML